MYPMIAQHVIDRLRAFRRNTEGQDLIEYALLVALIAVICVGAVTFAGQQVLAIFESIGTSLSNALS
jgi:pilus assembly protein Flp/PilA